MPRRYVARHSALLPRGLPAAGRAAGTRRARLAGDYPTGAEYGDIIAAREHEPEVCAAIGNALRDVRGEWDVIWMPNIAGWSGAVERARALAATAGMRVRSRPIRFGHIDLPARSATTRTCCPPTAASRSAASAATC
ncbi:MAG: hypothetical protein U1F25_20360 [Rubrivivax sp.]